MKTFFYYSLLLLGACLFSSQYALDSKHAAPNYENSLEIDGMNVEWEFKDDLLKFRLHSPTQGWLSLGFNETNDVVNANLVMGAVAQEATKMEEFFVLGFGNSQPINSLGGDISVKDFLGYEDHSGTSFEFSIDPSVQDDFHYELKEGNKIWLICAYSLADEFDHHSIMRRHIEIEL